MTPTLFRINPSQEALNIIRHGTAVEGGYVNNSADLGKATCHGITYNTSRDPRYKELWPLYDWDGDMKTLPLGLAYHIYYLGWWQRLKLSRIVLLAGYELAELMFDFGINAGRRNCVKSLQEILNVHNKVETLYKDLTVDGIMGQKTLDAIEGFLKAPYSNQKEKLLYGMHCDRYSHYKRISLSRELNETFTNGWSGRSYELAKKHNSVIFP